MIKVNEIDIKKLLREERLKRGLTYEDLASELGCSASYIFRIEKGRRKKPSYELVGKILAFFDLSSEELKKYIAGEQEVMLNTKERLEKDLLEFMKNMDVNNFSDIHMLTKKIKEYQKVQRL